MLVQDLMSRDVVTVEPDATALRAIELCREHGVRHLLVLGEEGEILGIVSDRDLKEAGPLPGVSEAKRKATLERTQVGGVMHEEVITALPTSPAERAAQEMYQRRIGCLPVVSEQEGLVGIVTTSDVLREAAYFWEGVRLLLLRGSGRA